MSARDRARRRAKRVVALAGAMALVTMLVAPSAQASWLTDLLSGRPLGQVVQSATTPTTAWWWGCLYGWCNTTTTSATTTTMAPTTTSSTTTLPPTTTTT